MMIFRTLAARVSLALFALTAVCHAAQRPLWPTPDTRFDEGRPYTEWAQPTASGKPESALFGCVRNGGRRFHEGLDIAPALERRSGEATDPVSAILDGRVVHINTVAGNSGYGRYVVLVHEAEKPAVYSLYAHLALVERGLKVGQTVTAGTVLGVMGRSALYSIPKDRAHLHLEIGVRLSERFQAWYDRQKFTEPNAQGVYNGMNLIGFDPLDFFERHRAGEVRSVRDYWSRIPVGFVLEVRQAGVPDMLRIHPELLAGPMPKGEVAGWRVAFSGWGLPLRFEPIAGDDPFAARPLGTLRVKAVNPPELERYACRDMVDMRSGSAKPGAGAERQIEIMFGMR